MIDHLRDTAITAARAAGRIQLKHFGQKLRVLSAPKFDLTLEIDKVCQEAIFDIIRSAYPDHAVVSEENSPINPTADFVWFIDPLDGTVNFFQGIWHFSTCIACYRTSRNRPKRRTAALETLSSLGEPLVGVIYAPVLDKLYVGIAGQTSTCNDQAIIPANASNDLCDAVISLSFGKDDAAIQRMEKLNSILIRRVRKIRVFGSTGLDIANVAEGRLSALIQCSVRTWDFAAARIILEQSGGRFHARETAPNRWEILASAESLYNDLKKIIRSAWSND